MTARTSRIIAMGLRLWTLATRFTLVFFLARFLTPGDVGLYGLLAATVAYVVYALGVDMYTYTTREILKTERTQWRRRVSSHTAFLGCIYVVVLPASLLLFTSGLLPWTIGIWFYLILVTEHIGMEIDRMLIAMSDQLAASVVIFTRQALLPTMVIPVLALVPAARSLNLVLAGWVIFNVAAIIFGAIKVMRKLDSQGESGVDWTWIRRGVKVSLTFFVGTLFLRALFTADRQIVAIFDGLQELGAYTLATSVGTGLSSVIAVSVHQFSYPKLVVAAHEKNITAFRKEMRMMTLQTLGIIALAGIVVLLLKDLLISWVGNGIYAQYSWLFLAAIGVFGLYNISLLPHFALYAMHADRAILVSTVASVLGFAVVAAIVLWSGGDATVGVIIGLAFASAMLLLTKGLVYARKRTDAFEGTD